MSCKPEYESDDAWRYFLEHATEQDAAEAMADVWRLSRNFMYKHKQTSDRLGKMVLDGEVICESRFGSEFSWIPF